MEIPLSHHQIYNPLCIQLPFLLTCHGKEPSSFCFTLLSPTQGLYSFSYSRLSCITRFSLGPSPSVHECALLSTIFKRTSWIPWAPPATAYFSLPFITAKLLKTWITHSCPHFTSIHFSTNFSLVCTTSWNLLLLKSPKTSCCQIQQMGTCLCSS